MRALLVEPGHEVFAAEVVAGFDPQPSVLVAVAEHGEPGREAAAGTVPDRPRDGLAYVIFTSGSTGTPKGAMVADGGMDNHLAAKIADLELGPADVVGLTAPLSFDISVWQTLVALTVGARTAAASPRNISEPAELVAWVRRHGVTVLEIVPSFLTVLTAQLDDDLKAGLSSLRYLVATGRRSRGGRPALVRALPGHPDRQRLRPDRVLRRRHPPRGDRGRAPPGPGRRSAGKCSTPACTWWTRTAVRCRPAPRANSWSAAQASGVATSATRCAPR
nr:AMP-binding protein [Streptomyces sp. C8S0]